MSKVGVETSYSPGHTVLSAVLATFGTMCALTLLGAPGQSRRHSNTYYRLWDLYDSLFTREFWLGSYHCQRAGYESLPVVEDGAITASLSTGSERSELPRSGSTAHPEDIDDMHSTHEENDSSGSNGLSLLSRKRRNPTDRNIILEFCQRLWEGATAKVIFTGLCIGLTLAGMHYTGMMAMQFDGIIIWDPWLVLASVLISWAVSLVAVIFMPTEMNAKRQLGFSFVAATGVSSMHCTSHLGAKFQLMEVQIPGWLVPTSTPISYLLIQKGLFPSR